MLSCEPKFYSYCNLGISVLACKSQSEPPGTPRMLFKI